MVVGANFEQDAQIAIDKLVKAEREVSRLKALVQFYEETIRVHDISLTERELILVNALKSDY